MSQYSNRNLLQNVPIEMYRKILFRLDPESLNEECSTNKYASQVCDKNFIRDYITYNFDPEKYNIDNWNEDVFKNFNVSSWRDLFKRLLSKKIVDVYLVGLDNPITRLTIPSLTIPIYFSDTKYDIKNRFKDIENDINNRLKVTGNQLPYDIGDAIDLHLELPDDVRYFEKQHYIDNLEDRSIGAYTIESINKQKNYNFFDNLSEIWIF